MPQIKKTIQDSTIRKLKEALLEISRQSGQSVELDCWANWNTKKVSIKSIDKKTVAN